MLSISPFNVAFDTTGVKAPLEKDSRWLSNPYVNENKFFTGLTHVNLSGVGCPELGVIIAMPTTGKLEVNHLNTAPLTKMRWLKQAITATSLLNIISKLKLPPLQGLVLLAITSRKVMLTYLSTSDLDSPNEKGRNAENSYRLPRWKECVW